ncbi:penicillin-insensitive murein endopeptidase [Solemya velum gill symbiont]|uniref:penicillin-insensitive murein endopeptidase n=1 Tax=Solemya velum gill symbiont TaxID=2340 RepID=UPI0009981640|nr:penicillin-insensitive murein endopeptidase [Solemya velum gill symbiont]OOY99653.1 penicillin-insensitive murein endopeptidase [Solemya velum gill symbiont]OOZ01836.1 penicillin-insensitive murein endopeptidase [Solemya velum gill symbiont]OOZ04175.1 penicillin-insensitive murein endopeptidase [Solemya velum gill symbiont]OOZ06417.1 penicillin-insensitive murein endopeptidase [Solemya velum gill symbiont]OOZ08579.1 penicillin-insensitive murein endopeptidase [Solemya velum gill symbiont]
MIRNLSLLAILFSGAVCAAPNSWEKFQSPLERTPEPIGSYANGCLIGAEALSAKGKGYQVVRLNRKRNYGHPNLVDFLEDLGKKVKKENLGLMLVADMAMPRGGPFTKGHTSHQTGLDVDIWLPLNYKNVDNLKGNLQSVSMVDKKAFVVNKRVWTDKQAQMIKLAADDKRVARIFVHPAIKKALCEKKWSSRKWLCKIRPWWKHDSHFHVRLKCPAGAVECKPQSPPPAGDGCGADLAAWYPENQPDKPAVKKPRPKRILPATCQALLKEAAISALKD